MSKITFEPRGTTIIDPSYTGDIGNHRITTEFNLDGVRFHINVQSTKTERKYMESKTASRGRELKTPIRLSDNDGLYIEIYAMYLEPITTCKGSWRMFSSQKKVYEEVFSNRPCHNKDTVLRIINAHLKSDYDELEIKGGYENV